MQKTSFVCDCGCRAIASSFEFETEGWLTLSQTEFKNSGDEIKIHNGPLHFKSFEHLAKWTSKALKAGKEMQEQAQSMSGHRGWFVNKKCPGIAV